jgi:hypothetical protein
MDNFTRKRNERRKILLSDIKNLEHVHPKSDSWQRQMLLISQDIFFLEEAAIDEGIEIGKEIVHP